jgi:hypothetical protein
MQLHTDLRARPPAMLPSPSRRTRDGEASTKSFSFQGSWAGDQPFRIFEVDEISRSEDGAKSLYGRVAQASAYVGWLRHHRSLS